MKLYAYQVIEADELNELFLDLSKIQECIENTPDVDEETRKRNVVEYHEEIRKKLNLPNKIFTFGRDKECTKACMILFDKEPDGNTHEVFVDEDRCPYIIVAESEE